MSLLSRIRQVFAKKKQGEPSTRRPEDVDVGRWPVYPALSFWTAEEMLAAMEQHKRARFQRSGLAAYELWSDNRVADGLRKRALALSTLRKEILAAPGGEQQAELLRGRGCSECQWEGCTRCGGQYDRIFPLGSLKDLQGLRILCGFSWGTLGGLPDWEDREGVIYPTLKPWHPSLVIWNWLDEHGQIGRGRWQVQTTRGIETAVPGDGRWVLFTEGTLDPWLQAEMLRLWPWCIDRQEALTGWARRKELHGNPWRVAHVPIGMSERPEVQKFYSQLENPGAEPVLLLPQATDGRVEAKFAFAEPKDNSIEIFDKGIDRDSNEISITLTGHNLLSEIKQGSQAAVETVDAGVRRDLLVTDALVTDTVLHNQVLRQWAWFNWGNADLAPKVMHIAPPAKAIESEARTAKLWAEAGAAAAAAAEKLQALGMGKDVDLVKFLEDCGFRRTRALPDGKVIDAD